ncbi:hypothetical protein SPBR_04351 [Sporothrix brasiliensis 5110]|uniref:Gfo/Idh/MocA-like oxidoreductase N-terminal domain-containing protein n=1 Tax=Sporothrix brasiliensis 5110 TaxID=1398154 RepID=A0A0C2JA21_9PEZI|nr:uncharacterized protein SPBR_04351 [Sporothrix brasiliensis 5110]KIH93772.1 hypothetical protein SPBR_04351 [Sporothrix brasiliensis 5110]
MTVVALLGAGIFVKDEHLPAVEAAESLTLGAVYSRSKVSAEALAAAATPVTTGKSLTDLLARADIGAVIVCLPILVQPAVISQALGAVAQNFRFLEVIQYAAERVGQMGGEVTTFHMKMNTLIGDDDKFFNTEWRKVPGYQGGFLLDGGVSAFTTLLQPKLAPVDTVQSILTTDKDTNGTFCVSFGTEFKSASEIEVVTTKGAVTLTPTTVTSTWVEVAGGDKKEDKKDFSLSSGVKPEVVAFGASLAKGAVDPRQSAEKALKDLAILEALLASADQGGAPLAVE